MLSLYIDNPSTDDNSIFNLTDDEFERKKIIEQERCLTWNMFYRFAQTSEPSLVLDDFLFLGSIHHATNHDLLERFKIRMFILTIEIAFEFIL